MSNKKKSKGKSVKADSKNKKSRKTKSKKNYKAAYTEVLKKNTRLKLELRKAKNTNKDLEKALKKLKKAADLLQKKAAKKKKSTKSKQQTKKTKSKKASPKPSSDTPKISAAKPKQESAKVEKKKILEPVNQNSNTSDNLKLINGIGPAIEKHLKAAGINTFAQLAKLTVLKLKAILIERGGTRYKNFNSISWAEQAKLAAAGKMEELKILQEKLKENRD